MYVYATVKVPLNVVCWLNSFIKSCYNSKRFIQTVALFMYLFRANTIIIIII